MKWSIARPRQRVQLAASLLMASGLSLLTIASASAQPLQPIDTVGAGVPTTLSVMPGLSTTPGQPPTMGVPLNQAQSAFRALSSHASAGASPTSSISAVFMAPVGVLSVIGAAQNNTIVVSRDAAGSLLVNGGAVPIQGPTPTVANTSLIELFGLDGDDKLALDETNGALPRALLFGGAGNDTLTGGSGNEQLFGQAGNDTLLGKGGDDLLFGGDGDDRLIGGTGNDQVFGQAGNDRIIWKPGDGTDLNEGGDGIDTIQMNGGNGAEVFTAVPNGSRVRFDRVSPAPFSLDIGTAEKLVLDMNGGDDKFTGANGLAPLINLIVDGGAGNDTIIGGDGNDILMGGDGNDTIIGGRGSDTIFGGDGDDVFVWNPGDGSDVIDGQSGTDTLQFNGANVSEHFDLSANGSRLRLLRDVANITMDVHDVEQINLTARGGVDTTTVNDLTGTGVTGVAIDLANPAGSSAGDGAVDTVVVNATTGDDVVRLSDAGNSLSVDGLTMQISVAGAEPPTN